MSNSINTNIAAYYAQANITAASNAASSSVARLSSGNRIVEASDDVAALATGTSLQTTVSALTSAQTNASQGTSLLQVADGALAQIQNILQQQKSIALQAGSGSLTDTDRGFLDQQFQALSQEIDSLSGSTTFNGVNLIDGSLSTGALVNNTTTQANAGALSINFGVTNPANGTTVIVNGVTLTATTSATPTTLQFAIGANSSATAANLAAKLTSLSQTTTYATSLGQALYTNDGSASVAITARTGGSLDNQFTVSANGTATVNGGASVGGNQGDASFNLFATGFASATSSVTLATASASQPFQNGNVITLTVNGTTANLYTVATGDSLTSIVTGINASSATTGVKAALTWDPTTKTYNISASFKDTTSSTVLYDLGTNYSNGTHALTGPIPGSHTSDVYADTQNLFASALNIAFNTTVVDTTGAGTAATPFKDGDVIQATLNGTAYKLYTIASGDKLNSIVAGINASTATTGIAAVLTGSASAFNIALYYNGAQNGLSSTAHATFIDTGTNTDASAVGSLTSSAVFTGSSLNQTISHGLDGGSDNGLGIGSTSVSGTVGDNLVTSLSQNPAQVTISFPDVAASALTAAGNFNSDGSVYLSVAGHNFAFTTTGAATKAADEITIGATLQDTLDNAVSTINNYLSSGDATGDVAYQLSQLNISRSGNDLVIQSKTITNPTNIRGGAASTIALTGFSNGAPVSNSGALNNASNTAGSTYGVDTTGVSNSAFTGTINGFSANYVSSNTVNLSVQVGNYTYTATNVPTNNTSNQTIRLTSNTLADGSNGGYFDIQLAANQGLQVGSQSDANLFATQVNGAFNSLNFSQERNLSSYNPTQTIVADNALIGSLIGSKVSAQLATFGANKLSDVSVTAPTTTGGDASIALTIDGEVFQSATGLGSQLGANQTYRLTSTSNSNHYVDFTTGNSTIDLSTADDAKAVQTALASAFGAGNGSAALSFQIGQSVSDSISVSIGSAKTNTLFAGQTLDVSTQSDAANASSVLDTAINSVTSLRSTVGALESQFNFASAALQSSVQNQSAAEGQLLDTNIATESTAFATDQVKLQAGISVLAQANQQLQALLKLIG